MPILWSFAGHSATGTAHVQAGLPCQDVLGRTAAGVARHVVAIADGAGSAKHCQEGARLASETIISVISQYQGSLKEVSEIQGVEFGRQVVSVLADAAKTMECELGDFACTLLAAAFEGTDSYFWQVGDGAWIVESSKGIECATWPFKGEFNNQTAFITSEDWESDPKWKHAFYDDATAAMGFTDGLEMFCLDTASQQPHLPFVERIFAALRNNLTETEAAIRIEQMLASPVIKEREDDDLTVMLAWQSCTNAPG
jgi:serine/threonine protein phosphatase PrpC